MIAVKILLVIVRKIKSYKVGRGRRFCLWLMWSAGFRFSFSGAFLIRVSGAISWGTAVRAGRPRVWFPMGVIGIFHRLNPSCPTMALGSTQPLTEMSSSGFYWGLGGREGSKGGRCHLHVPTLGILGTSTSWSPKDLSRRVMRCLYLHLTFLIQNDLAQGDANSYDLRIYKR